MNADPTNGTATAPAPELSRLRLNLLRLAYAPVAIGLAIVQLPLLLEIGPAWEMMDAVVVSMLSAICLLSFIGLLRPVSMLPLLLFEVAWKLLWLGLVGVPAWLSGPLEPPMAGSLFACALIAPIIMLIPWDFVVKQLIRSKT